MSNHQLRNLAAICCIIFLLSACSSSDEPGFRNCENTTIDLEMNGRQQQLGLLNSYLARIHNNDGNFKLYTLEALSDSFKIVMNLKDGSYPISEGLQADSILKKTYTYSRTHKTDTSGLLVLGVKAGNTYNFYPTDTAAITVTGMDPVARTISGKYYFATKDATVTGSGSFNRVCFLSFR